MLHLAVISTIVIVLSSVIPVSNIPGSEETVNISFNILHLVFYITSSFLWHQSLESKRKYMALIAVIVPLTEIVQFPLPYRSSNIEDLRTNIIGAAIGSSISWLFKRKVQRLLNIGFLSIAICLLFKTAFGENRRQNSSSSYRVSASKATFPKRNFG